MPLYNPPSAGVSSAEAQVLIDASITALGDLFTYKGVIACAGNPNYPAANAGDAYIVSSAGKIGGASGLTVQIGDALICNTDGTTAGTQEQKGAYWGILQTNIDSADYATAAQGAKADTALQAVTVEKDIVCTAPITVNGTTNLDNVLPGADADVTLALTQNIPGINRYLSVTIIDPKAAYGKDHEICLMAKTPAALTVTNLEVICDADPTTELTGDLKWADSFIGLGNAAVINDFDTTAGARSDSSITSGAVAAGKCIYLSFDAEPDAAMTQMSVVVTFDFD